MIYERVFDCVMTTAKLLIDVSTLVTMALSAIADKEIGWAPQGQGTRQGELRIVMHKIHDMYEIGIQRRGLQDQRVPSSLKQPRRAGVETSYLPRQGSKRVFPQLVSAKVQ